MFSDGWIQRRLTDSAQHILKQTTSTAGIGASGCVRRGTGGRATWRCYGAKAQPSIRRVGLRGSPFDGRFADEENASGWMVLALVLLRLLRDGRIRWRRGSESSENQSITGSFFLESLHA